MERFQRNMKQAMQETGNSKRIFFVEILISVCILMGCGVQETDQAQELAPEPVTVHSSEEIPQMDRPEEEEEAAEEEAAEAEDKPHVFTDETAELLLEQAQKAMEKAIERSDVNNEEHPAEEEIRSYLSGYFAPDILDYILYVYQIKIKDGKCFCGHNDYWKNFYMNTNGEVRIIEQGEDYCDISVTFQHRWRRAWDEEEGTVRVEKDERGYWVITKMNQWYNDLRYYYMRDTDYEPVYLTKEAAEWLIREFGADENGEKVQICAQTDEDGYILQGSSERRLTEEEIGALSRYELFLAAQEIYAENPETLYRGVKLWERKSGTNASYFIPLLEEIPCLSERTQYNSTGNRIVKPVLDKSKIGEAAVFKIKNFDRNCIVGREDFVESILRRRSRGIRMEEVESE